MTDYDNRLLNRDFQAGLAYNGPLQSYGVFRANFGKMAYLGKEFNINRIQFIFILNPGGSLLMCVMSALGDYVDFVNARQGRNIWLNLVVQYKVGRHLFLLADHIYERLRIDAGRLYTANVSNIMAVYRFNRRAFLRLKVQYVDYDYATKLYNRPRDPKFKHLFSQLLFSYKINPQTVLYLGYSDDYLGYSAIPLKQSNRTFFMKIGYALVL